MTEKERIEQQDLRNLRERIVESVLGKVNCLEGRVDRSMERVIKDAKVLEDYIVTGGNIVVGAPVVWATYPSSSITGSPGSTNEGLRGSKCVSGGECCGGKPTKKARKK
jgi:hypothetical protein